MTSSFSDKRRDAVLDRPAGQFDLLSYFKNLTNISVTTLYNCQTIYLKYVESQKMLASSVISGRH